MHLAYPYNEILPKNTAHDGYIFRNLASLANVGCHSKLICGRGSLPVEELYPHYAVDHDVSIRLKLLPMVRKPFGLPLSLNQLFFFLSQRHMARTVPDIILLSVFKQAEYHLQRPIPSARYVYEVHQLAWYPNSDTAENRAKAQWERKILQKMDLVTVTTPELRNILLQPPYSLDIPIRCVPLATEPCEPLPLLPSKHLRLGYVGQLYASQGVEQLVRAVAAQQGVELEVIGGNHQQVQFLKDLCTQLGCLDRVHLHGFVPSPRISKHLQGVHALVAPFLDHERMPYVAHTKLLEYASWGLPVVAPDIEGVRSCFKNREGLYLYSLQEEKGLKCALEKVHVDFAAKSLKTPLPNVWTWEQRAKEYGAILSLLACS